MVHVLHLAINIVLVPPIRFEDRARLGLVHMELAPGKALVQSL